MFPSLREQNSAEIVQSPMETSSKQKKLKFTNGRHNSSQNIASVFQPGVLLANLLLLFRREVVDDAEMLTQLLGGLALDLLGHVLAGVVHHALDIEVVGGLDINPSSFKQYNKNHHDQIEHRVVIDFEVLLIPLRHRVVDLLGQLGIL